LIGAIVLVYMGPAEVLKRWFYAFALAGPAGATIFGIRAASVLTMTEDPRVGQDELEARPMAAAA
jgi:hypothetical protein